jgi:predicted dehydrogenase
MDATVTVAMLALGGYGNFYLPPLFEEAQAHNVEFVAGIDPNPVTCRHLARFEAVGIPIYPDLDSFYAESHADLVVMSPPIHLHAPFTRRALGQGSSVLCEKPAAATIQEVHAMAAAEAASEGFVAIGYQWSFSAAIQALKRDVLDGELGRPLRMRTKVFWPRTDAYYGRNNWAGKLQTADGRWVLDSPVNNAAAHYLHNCFYVLGPTRETSARPRDVQAELYRANPIENYDTAALRCHTEEGVEVLFYAAHPLLNNLPPILHYEFERATVTFEDWQGPLLARFEDGHVKNYGNPFADERNKLWDSVDAVRTGAPVACGIEAAASHTLCMNGAQTSSPIHSFPEDLVHHADQDGQILTWVEDLQAALTCAYDRGKLPSECGRFDWARPGEVVDLRGYDHFPAH